MSNFNLLNVWHFQPAIITIYWTFCLSLLIISRRCNVISSINWRWLIRLIINWMRSWRQICVSLGEIIINGLEVVGFFVMSRTWTLWLGGGVLSFNKTNSLLNWRDWSSSFGLICRSFYINWAQRLLSKIWSISRNTCFYRA